MCKQELEVKIWMDHCALLRNWFVRGFFFVLVAGLLATTDDHESDYYYDNYGAMAFLASGVLYAILSVILSFTAIEDTAIDQPPV